MSELGARIIAIEKADEDKYIVNIAHEFIKDERVDGPKLLAMLSREELPDATPQDVLGQVDAMVAGQKLLIRLR